MIRKIKKILKNEAAAYLFWGIAATAVNWVVYTAASLLTVCGR